MENLTFLTGFPGSGKSHCMTEKLRVLAEAGKSTMLIVPEQYSSTAERRTYEALGISLFNRINVTTFSRVKRDIVRRSSGLSGRIPDEAAKTALMYAVRRELVPSDMKFYGSQIKNPAFVPSCIRMVRELDLNGISCAELRSSEISDSALSGKIEDIVRICGAYGLMLDECGYVGALSNGEEISAKAAELKYFRGQHIFIDQFKSFTADERMLIETMASQADVCICMPTPYDSPCDSSVYGAVSETIGRLCREDRSGCTFIHPENETGRFSGAPGIGMLSRNVLNEGNAAEGSVPGDNIHIYEADSVRAEADFVCAEISRMVRSGKYRCEDIAVLSRCLDEIRPVLTDALERYELPYFADIPRSAAQRPLMIFVMTALEAASSDKPQTEVILRLLKTFMTSVTEKHISELECFCTEHGITRESFEDISEPELTYEKLKGYDLLPEEERSPELYPAELFENAAVRAGAILSEVMLPLAEFRKACGKENTLRAVCTALADLIDKLHTDEIIMSADHDTEEGREQRRLRRLLGDTLTRLAEVTLPDRSNSFTIKEFREILGIVISGEKISSPAHSLSCVTVSSSDRARLDSPKVVFIMSAVNGMFPFRVGESGIFSERELEIIEGALGLRFAARMESVACEENFIAVNSIASPSEELYITYPLSDISGKPLYASPLTDEICRLTGKKPEKVSALPPEFFMTTAGSAFSRFIEDPSGQGALTPGKIAAVREVYKDEIGRRMDRAAEYFSSVRNRSIFFRKIEPDNALRLFAHEKNGVHNLGISASGLEEYAMCPFKFLCDRGLRLSSPKKPDMTANIRGTAVHGILSTLLGQIKEESEKAEKSFGEYFCDMPEKDISERIDALMEGYITETFVNEGISMPPSAESTLRKQTETLQKLVMHIREEFSPENSRFEPYAFEFSVGRTRGRDGDIPAWCLSTKTADGKKLNVLFRGDADRIDVFEDNSSGSAEHYLRVADYKTGSTKFVMNDLLYGVNMQMLLYLFAVTNSLKADDGKPYSPAGVLYVPSKLPKNESGERFRGNAETVYNESIEKAFRMNGITLDLPNVIRAMETGADGKFIEQQLNSGNFRAEFGRSCADIRTDKDGTATLIKKKKKKLCEDMSPEEREFFTVSLCRILSADDPGPHITELSERYPEKDIRGAVSDMIAKYADIVKQAEASDEKAAAFTAAIRNIPLIYDVYRYFYRYFPEDNGGEARKAVNEALTAPAGKAVYPSPEKTISPAAMDNIRKYIEEKILTFGSAICGGTADAKPLIRKDPCKNCDFRGICINAVPISKSFRYSYNKDSEKQKIRSVLESGKEE